MGDAREVARSIVWGGHRKEVGRQLKAADRGVTRLLQAHSHAEGACRQGA